MSAGLDRFSQESLQAVAVAHDVDERGGTIRLSGSLFT